MNVVFRTGPEPLLQEHLEKIQELYKKFIVERAELARKSIDSLVNFVVEQSKAAKSSEQGKDRTAAIEQTGERISADVCKPQEEGSETERERG
jgi:hypothetical protein